MTIGSSGGQIAGYAGVTVIICLLSKVTVVVGIVGIDVLLGEGVLVAVATGDGVYDMFVGLPDGKTADQLLFVFGVRQEDKINPMLIMNKNRIKGFFI